MWAFMKRRFSPVWAIKWSSWMLCGAGGTGIDFSRWYLHHPAAHFAGTVQCAAPWCCFGQDSPKWPWFIGLLRLSKVSSRWLRWILIRRCKQSSIDAVDTGSGGKSSLVNQFRSVSTLQRREFFLWYSKMLLIDNDLKWWLMHKSSKVDEMAG